MRSKILIPHHKLRRTYVALLALLTTATLAVPASASATVVLGAYTRALYGNSELAINELQTELGVEPQIAMYYQDWNPRWTTALINPKIISPLLRQGIVPMITWEPSSAAVGSPNKVGYSLSRIAEGTYDTYLWRAAREAASFQHSLFVRLAPEMNGTWDSWGVRPGNSPGDYVAMWRHVVSIFRAAGASNVRWVWSPNVYGSNSTTPFNPYYPGNSWVNDVALDGYNWGTIHDNSWAVNDTSWMTFDQVFQASYNAIALLSPKPLMIAETASTELGGSKATWISEIPRALEAQMPRVRALIWFDVDKETDWSFNSSPSSLSAFRDLASRGVFSSSLSELLSPTSQDGSAARVHRARQTAHRRHRNRHRARRAR